MRKAEVVIPFREPFRPLFATRKKRIVVVAHRRAGKTVAAVQKLLGEALRCTKPNPRYAYIAPFLKQAKTIAWDYLKSMCAGKPGVEINESELRVDLPNSARVRLFGADNPDALRGIYLDGAVLDEFGDMDPRALTSIIYPALADRDGWLVVQGTPKGRNRFWDIYDSATRDLEWEAMCLRASETGLLRPQVLAEQRRQLAPEEYEQEFECSFTAAVRGAYYGKLMEAAEAEGRVTRVPHDPAVPVVTAWDLGMRDSTPIWFLQQAGREIRAIDYYEMSGASLDHYAKMLQEKRYLYGEHILPHDVEVKEIGTGRSRKETLHSLGVRPIRVAPNLGREDGINAVRMLLPRMWFDAEKCQRGIEALRLYRTEFDDKLQTFKANPLHDWTSHAADAMRMFAVAHRDVKAKPSTDPYRTRRSSGGNSWMAA